MIAHEEVRQAEDIMKQHHSNIMHTRRLVGGGLRLVLLAAFVALALAGCNRGGSGTTPSMPSTGDNGGTGTAPKGLVFTYPFDGQKSVPPAAAIRLQYQGGIGTDEAGKLTLVTTDDGQSVAVTPDVSSNGNFVVLKTTDALKPDTQYSIQRSGQKMVTFTTAPNPGTPSADGFEVVRVSPGGGGIPFVTFNTLHMYFSEAVDPSTIAVGDGFSMTDVGGNEVPGVLYIKGRNLAFDPQDDQLKPGETYTVTIGPDVKSVFGNSLTANNNSTFDLTPRTPGSITKAALQVVPDNQADTNKVTLSSQLLGVNHLDVKLQSAAMQTVVSQNLIPAPALGGSVMPIAVRRGGSFEVSELDVKLGDKLPMNLNSGLLRNTFITDLSAWFIGNPYNSDGAVNVRMRFDVALSGANNKGNGAVNQNVLNVPAVGTVKADGNGNLTIDSLGSFVVSANGTDTATVNFRLHLAAPGKVVAGDSTPPTIVGQYPSACAYTYGTGLKLTPILLAGTGTQGPLTDADGNFIPAQDPPQGLAAAYIQRQPDLYPAVDATNATCAQYLADQHNGSYLYTDAGNAVSLPSATGTGTFPYYPLSWMPTVDGINNVLPEISPSVTFSQPVDPASLHNTNGVQLLDTTTNAPVPAALRVQGTTVIVAPDQPLDYNTEYTLSVGTGVTDLAGNALTAGRQIVFHTAPYVPSTDGDKEVLGAGTFFERTHRAMDNIIETAPFLTTLYPGLPCALTGGNFKTGGDTAGYCTGSDQSSSAPMRKWGVFKLPANRAVHMVFSKPVQSSSIVLANGCLTATDGVAAPASNNGSVAVQIMDSSGQCTGVVDAGVLLPHPDYPYTRALSIRPANPWQPGQRYWLVVCGSNNANATCVTGKTIVDVDNGKPATNFEAFAGFPTHNGHLNTDPMNGTGTNGYCGALMGLNATEGPFYGCPEGAGGPDLVMPFDGAPASQDQFLITRLAPFTDVNGNGFAEGGNFAYRFPPGTTSITDLWDDPFAAESQLDPQDRERPTAMNRVMTFSSAAGSVSVGNAPDVYTPVYDSGAQPSAVGDVRSAAACNAMMPADVQAMTGSNHGQCAPVTVYPGGLVAQTAANVGHAGSGTPYGRTLLFTRGVPDPDNPAGTVPQTAYIVDHCQGSYRLNPGIKLKDLGVQKTVLSNNQLTGGTVHHYDYSPCFVYQQQVIFTADPKVVKVDSQTGKLCFFGATCQPGVWNDIAPQTGLTIDLVGPVSFDRNGRLVIRATNTNNIVLKDTKSPQGGAPAPVFIPPSYVTVQLLGPVIHGGPLNAFKTQ